MVTDDGFRWAAQRDVQYRDGIAVATAAGDDALAAQYRDALKRIDISGWSAMVAANMTPPRVWSLDELCALAVWGAGRPGVYFVRS